MGPNDDDTRVDAALARRVAGGGDSDAEAELCRRLFPRVRAYGLRKTRDRAFAADAAQQVMVILIESLRAGRVENPERLAAFVIGTCRNTILDFRKGERRKGALLERFGPSMAAIVETDQIGLDRDKLEGCLQRLGERERAIVALTFFAERAVDEIASELGMTAGTVRVARHRALKRLHDCVTGAPAGATS